MLCKVVNSILFFLNFQSIYNVINSLVEGETYQLVVGNTGEGEFVCFVCTFV